MRNQTLDYYNSNAADFTAATGDLDFHEIEDLFLTQVREAFPERPEKDLRLLDLGCGSGRDARYFLDRGFAVQAVDGSEAMCRAASEKTGLVVRQLLFEDFHETAAYEGIWACASLLHVPLGDLPAVLDAIEAALVPGGIFYASFKYGSGEREKGGRHFTDMDEAAFDRLAGRLEGMWILRRWLSCDARPDRKDEYWLNILMKKRH